MQVLKFHQKYLPYLAGKLGGAAEDREFLGRVLKDLVGKPELRARAPLALSVPGRPP